MSKESHRRRIPPVPLPTKSQHETKVYRYPGLPYIILEPAFCVYIPMLAAKLNGANMFAMPEDGPVFNTLAAAEAFLQTKLEESRAAEQQIPLYVPAGVRRVH